MTVIEQRTMELVGAAARKIANTDINWEQRRYEIAKDVISVMQHDTPEEMAAAAVEVADALIAALRKKV